MSTTSNVAEFPADSRPAQPRDMTVTRPMYWSVRRELWENRFLFIAPVAVALLSLFGFTISTIGMPERRRAVLQLDPAAQRARIGVSYDVVAMILIVAAFLIGLFYCLEALHGERRDRSILFWKSLPVSDLTTVLAKASIPLVVLPSVTFVIIVVTHFMMLLHTSIVLMSSGLAGTTWSRFNLIEQSLILFYGLVAIAMWHAPVYGWLLLMSAWAKRATFLWAVFPVFAAAAMEKVAFNTTHLLALVKYRVMGGVTRAFAFSAQGTVGSLDHLTPARFLSTPGLWIGLLFAAAFVTAAVRIRRHRDPN